MRKQLEDMRSLLLPVKYYGVVVVVVKSRINDKALYHSDYHVVRET